MVEIDGSKFGKRKQYRGMRVNGVWILGRVERTSGRKIFLAPVLKRDKTSLHNIRRKCAKKYNHPHRYVVRLVRLGTAWIYP